MHKKCQLCIFIRQVFVSLLVAGMIALLTIKAGLAFEITLWSAFAGAVIPLMWFGYSQRKKGE